MDVHSSARRFHDCRTSDRDGAFQIPDGRMERLLLCEAQTPWSGRLSPRPRAARRPGGGFLAAALETRRNGGKTK